MFGYHNEITNKLIVCPKCGHWSCKCFELKEPKTYWCEHCEIEWDAADCDRGKVYGKWIAHCPNCKKDMKEKK